MRPTAEISLDLAEGGCEAHRFHGSSRHANPRPCTLTLAILVVSEVYFRPESRFIPVNTRIREFHNRELLG